MMRSMFAGVSGLTAHQDGMDVIGDNISNINTIGYKGSNVNFAEVMAQTEAAAQGPREGRGGINPQQVGLGVDVGSIKRDQTQGSLESTGVPTDAAIDGDGHFVVNDGAQNFFTRNGSFELDGANRLVSSSHGFRVQGWDETEVDEGEISVDRDAGLGDIEINVGEQMPEGIDMFTSEARLDGNLNTDVDYEEVEGGSLEWDDDEDEFLFNGDEPHNTITFDVFDAQGRRHTIAMDFIKTGQDGDDVSDWEAGMRIANFEDYEDQFYDDDGDLTNTDEAVLEDNITFEFDADGRLIMDDDGDLDDEGIWEETEIHELFGGINEFKIDEDIGDEDFVLDFSRLTQLADDFSVRGRAEDGYEPGTLDNFSIDSDGVIVGQYTNGLSAAIGQIAVADFANPSGLVREGDSLFLSSANSGEPNIGVAGTGGRGEIQSGTLEMSNVDLAEEFTDMIRTQRGYQANSSTITTSDEMLQELVNLTR